MRRFIVPIIILSGGLIVIIFKSLNLSSSNKQYLNNQHQLKEKKLNSKLLEEFENAITETSTSFNLSEAPPISFALEIKGDSEFRTKTKNAIRLLWNHEKDGAFAVLRKHVFEIRQSNRTTFIFDGDKPIIELSDKMVRESSITFLASVIAHNAWHSWYLTQKKLKNKKKEIPHPSKNIIEKNFIPPFGLEFKNYDGLFEVENQASNYQIKILEKLKAPSSEIYKIKNRQKNDFSNAHDGNFIVQY